MQKDIYSSDNVLIHYDVSENFTPKNYLVFLHGLGGDLTALDLLRGHFHKAGYSTLAIDLRGQGNSGRPHKKNAYELPRVAEDVISVINEEKLTDFILIGHCYGGMVAVRVAHELKEKIKQLVLIDSSYGVPWFGKIFKLAPITMRMLFSIPQILPNIHLKTAVNYSKFIGGGDYSLRRICSDILHTSIRSYAYISETLLGFDLRNIIKEIPIPTLIIEGRKDHIYPPKIAEELHRLIKNSKITYIEKGNHIVVLSNSEEVFNAIGNYLSVK